MVSLRPAEDPLSFDLLDSLSLEDVTFTPAPTPAQDASLHTPSPEQDALHTPSPAQDSIHTPSSELDASQHPAQTSAHSEVSGVVQSTVFANQGAEEGSNAQNQVRYEGN